MELAKGKSMLFDYRVDLVEVKERHTMWWKRELTGRPLLYINYPRTGVEDVPKDLAPTNPVNKRLGIGYRTKYFEEMLRKTNFYADAVPIFPFQ